MESWFPWRWAPGGPLHPSSLFLALQLLSLLLAPWTLQLVEGQSVTQNGLPIIVSLANTVISFSCKISNQNVPEFTVGFYFVTLQGQKSSEVEIRCQHSPGGGNQTWDCLFQLSLPDSSHTGTYYCCLHQQDHTVKGYGTFILVRDTGYQQPPPSSQKALYFGFTGLLSVLSVLGTALLLWKKKRMLILGKHPDPKSAGRPTKPPEESIYTGLQRRETEVYACMETEAGSPHFSQSPRSKEKPYRFEDDSEFNMVYENI